MAHLYTKITHHNMKSSCSWQTCDHSSFVRAQLSVSLTSLNLKCTEGHIDLQTSSTSSDGSGTQRACMHTWEVSMDAAAPFSKRVDPNLV